MTSDERGRILRYERARKGLTQQQVADQVGTSRELVSRWEAGKVVPQPHHRVALGKLFGKTIEELGFVDDVQTADRDPTAGHNLSADQLEHPARVNESSGRDG